MPNPLDRSNLRIGENIDNPITQVEGWQRIGTHRTSPRTISISCDKIVLITHEVQP